MAKKGKFQNQLLVGLLFGILLFCSFNGCSYREGFFGGGLLNTLREGATGSDEDENQNKGNNTMLNNIANAAGKAVNIGAQATAVFNTAAKTGEGIKKESNVDDVTDN